MTETQSELPVSSDREAFDSNVFGTKAAELELGPLWRRFVRHHNDRLDTGHIRTQLCMTEWCHAARLTLSGTKKYLKKQYKMDYANSASIRLSAIPG